MEKLNGWLSDTVARIGSWVTKGLYRGLGSRWYNTLPQSVDPTCELFSHAEKSVHIVCDEDTADFLLTDCVMETLRKRAERNPALEIVFVCGHNPVTKTLQALREHHLHSLQKVEVVDTGTEPSLLWAVVDGTHVRLQHPHKDTRGNAHGRIVYNAPRLAHALEQRFEDLRRQVRDKNQEPVSGEGRA